MIRGIVFTHANLGAALCEVMESLLGPQNELTALSNADLSSDAMLAALEAAAAPAADGVMVFTALYGGSCWQTAERYRRQHPGSYHLTGTNLPMLLAFVNKRTVTPIEELAGMLADYGRRGIRP
jgi:mannose/fructose-specific phosphotransferase system component IIA